MSRVLLALIGLACAAGLVGCGVRARAGAAGRAAADRGASGCTDTWTAQGGGDKYVDPGNWSRGSVPGIDDAACIPPGAYVVVDSLPAVPAFSLVIEGKVCLLRGLNGLARTILNGIPSGHRPLASLPGNASAQACPEGTVLSMDGEHRRAGAASPPPAQAVPPIPNHQPPSSLPDSGGPVV